MVVIKAGWSVRLCADVVCGHRRWGRTLDFFAPLAQAAATSRTHNGAVTLSGDCQEIVGSSPALQVVTVVSSIVRIKCLLLCRMS